MKNLKSFSARRNKLERLELEFLQYLELLDLGDNHISFFEIPVEMTLLSSLMLDHQNSSSL